MAEEKISSGVQQLIDRLKEEGIEAGREEAARIIDEARIRAEQILRRAESEADKIRSQARREAEQLQNAAHEALNLAARDTVLELKASLTGQFSRRVREMIADTINDRDFLQRVVLEIAGRVRQETDDDEKLEILLPARVIGLDELRRHPEKVREGELGRFVLGISAKMFRDGVTFGVRASSGITILLRDRDLEITLDEKTVGTLLLDHLLPRFRALLEGAIQ